MKPLSFVSIIVINDWFGIIGKTIKTLGFHNNMYLLNLSSLDVSSRDAFRTLSNIKDGAFCENSSRLSAVYFFRKTFHFEYLRWLWIRLRHQWHKFSNCILNQVKREHIPIKVWLFCLRIHQMKTVYLLGQRNFLLVHKFKVCYRINLHNQK